MCESVYRTITFIIVFLSQKPMYSIYLSQNMRFCSSIKKPNAFVYFYRKTHCILYFLVNGNELESVYRKIIYIIFLSQQPMDTYLKTKCLFCMSITNPNTFLYFYLKAIHLNNTIKIRCSLNMNREIIYVYHFYCKNQCIVNMNR